MEGKLGRDSERIRTGNGAEQTAPASDVYEGKDPWEAYREAEKQRPEVIWPTWSDEARGKERTGQ